MANGVFNLHSDWVNGGKDREIDMVRRRDNMKRAWGERSLCWEVMSIIISSDCLLRYLLLVVQSCKIQVMVSQMTRRTSQVTAIIPTGQLLINLLNPVRNVVPKQIISNILSLIWNGGVSRLNRPFMLKLMAKWIPGHHLFDFVNPVPKFCVPFCQNVLGRGLRGNGSDRRGLLPVNGSG